ncbi:MAG: hypothetical protein ACE5J7_00275 [Candidatus Aenigmatarchaeota archaeon]
MVMENIGLLMIYSAPLILVFYHDRKNIKQYVLLGIVTLVLAFLFELISTTLGFWHYSATPKIFTVAAFSLFAYFPWLSYTYFAGNLLRRRL